MLRTNGPSREGFREEASGKDGRKDISGVHRAGIGWRCQPGWRPGLSLEDTAETERRRRRKRTASSIDWLLLSAQHTCDLFWYLPDW